MTALSLLPQIGAIAGWKLELAERWPQELRAQPVTFSSSDYRGSIAATLMSGLAPGSFTFVIEDVSEDEFRTLSARAYAGTPLEARLYLYWLDAPVPVGGGLVAVLRVTSLFGGGLRRIQSRPNREPPHAAGDRISAAGY